jgi:hypothetical protein
LAVSVAVAGAQDPKDTPKDKPEAPAGWKYVDSKDGSYQFLFPAETKRAGTRTRTFRGGGLSGSAQTNYCSTKDNLALSISATNLSGASLKGLTIKDVYDKMIDADKEDKLNTEVSEAKEFAIGKAKAREYYINNASGEVTRKVLYVVKNRVYELLVTAPTKDATAVEAADTFLKSLVIIPKAAPAKDKDTKDTPKDKPAPTKEKPPVD